MPQRALHKFFSMYTHGEFILGSSPTVYKPMKRKEQHISHLLRMESVERLRRSALCQESPDKCYTLLSSIVR